MEKYRGVHKNNIMTLNDLSRRKFVKASSVLSSGVALSAPFIAKASPKNNSETLKIGLIGIVGRGSGVAAPFSHWLNYCCHPGPQGCEFDITSSV